MPKSPLAENLIFSGGGAAALPAFAGALHELSIQPQFSYYGVKSVLGTSAGAIAALLVSLRYAPDEILIRLSTLNLKRFNQGFNVVRLFTTYGLYDSAYIYELIKQIISDKISRDYPDYSFDPANITFNDLKKLGYLNLYALTTKMEEKNGEVSGEEVVFSPENFGDTPVAAAVFVSVSASPVFPAVWLKKTSATRYEITNMFEPNAEMFNDGGLMSNFAVNFFDKPQYIIGIDDPGVTQVRNQNTLGISLVTKQQLVNDDYQPEIKRVPPGQLVKFATGLINTVTADYRLQNLDKDGTAERTIEIDRLGINGFNFEISHQTIQDLIQSGRKGVRDYFSNSFNNEQSPLKESSVKLK